jgi:hypothetical protein
VSASPRRIKALGGEVAGNWRDLGAESTKIGSGPSSDSSCSDGHQK